MTKLLFKGDREQFINLHHAIDNSDNNLPKVIDVDSWNETHFEVVSQITFYSRQEPITSPLVADRQENFGLGGLYELASELTDEFETLHEGREWDGEFFDTINEFLDSKLLQDILIIDKPK